MAQLKSTEGKLQDSLAAATSLSQTTQQIQILDYELHATLRIIAAGGLLDPAQRAAFIAASSQRSRLMGRVIRHVVGARPQ
jgi:hypothetical protein